MMMMTMTMTMTTTTTMMFVSNNLAYHTLQSFARFSNSPV